MENSNFLEIQKVLQEHRIIVSFSGKFTQGLIEELGDAVKNYLESENFPKKEVFHVFSIFIEQTQNIKNYCLSKFENKEYDRISNSSIVAIGKTENGNFICSGNLIEKQDVKAMVDKLDYIISLDKNELKKVYKSTLKKELEAGSTGAGLGLIEMARKASIPLEYTIVEVNENLSFFTLKAEV